MLLLTLVVRLPRLDDWNSLPARGENTTLDIYVLPFPFRRDRLSEGGCGRNGARERVIKAEAGDGRRRGLNRPYGAPSVKNGFMTPLSGALPTGGY